MSPGLPRSPSSWRNLSWASLAGIASPFLLRQLDISGPAPPQVYRLPCLRRICPGVLPGNGFWKGFPFSQTSSFSNLVCPDWACYLERLRGIVFDFLFLWIYSSYWRMAVTLVSRESWSASSTRVPLIVLECFGFPLNMPIKSPPSSSLELEPDPELLSDPELWSEPRSEWWWDSWS